MVTLNPKGKRKPVKRVPTTARKIEPAKVKPVPSDNIPKPQTVTEYAKAMVLKDREIAHLKTLVNQQQAKLAAVKRTAVHMGAVASKSNTVSNGVVSDWSMSILKTVNETKQP